MVNKIGSYGDSGMRIGGMSSGFDTDEIVSKLMAAEKMKADRLEAEKQIYQWQQERYRDIIGQMTEFKDRYFNVLNKDNYLLSFNTVRKVECDSDAISILASADALNKNHVVNGISKLASASEATSVKKIVGRISGKVDLTNIPMNFNNKGFTVTVDGVTREVYMVNDYNNTMDFARDLQTLLDGQFGTGRVKVDINGGKFLVLSAPNSRIIVQPGDEEKDLLSMVGITGGDQNTADLNATLERLFGSGAQAGYKFAINDVEFFFTGDTKLSTVIQTINASDAGVSMEYSGLEDRLSIISRETGTSSYVKLVNLQGNFFGEDGASGIGEGTHRNGSNAEFYLDDAGKTNLIVRPTNHFTIDGVTYSLKNTTDQAIHFSIVSNGEGMFDKIVSYIHDFNRLMESLENTMGEKKYNEFKPLTAEQKEHMKENDIKLWEEKAKSGILQNDSLLSGLKNKLRNTVSGPIADVSLTLARIGIKPSQDISKFRLEIDESKLKDWLAKDPDQVAALFSKRSDIDYSADLTLEEKNRRSREVGFAHKVSDIFSDYIRTNRNSSNIKGLLIERAGIRGDASFTTNAIYKKIEAVEKSIGKMNEWLKRREEQYWKQFSAMEVALSRLYSQSDWLTMQFSNWK